MADTYFYTVTSGTYTRSNKDGSQTTFVKGETVESEDAELATRKKNLEAMTPGKLPNPAGFIPKRVQQEVASTTVAQAHAAEARTAAAKSQAKTESQTAGENKATTPVVPNLGDDKKKG
jgi:hypothetical protein